jgi:hypothetical protein
LPYNSKVPTSTSLSLYGTWAWLLFIQDDNSD